MVLADGGEHLIQLELRGQFLSQAKAEMWSAGDTLDNNARAAPLNASQLPYNQGTRNLQLVLSDLTGDE